MIMLNRMRLDHLLNYDKTTGIFTRKVSVRKDRIGAVAGAPNGFGHIQIRVDGTLYMAHRLAWMWVYGDWPPTNIDHVNGNPSDNRITNLRLATPKENQENVKLRVDSSTGHRGVNWNKAERKWVARVQHHKERIVIGKYEAIEDAVSAIKEARDILFTHNKTEYAA